MTETQTESPRVKVLRDRYSAALQAVLVSRHPGTPRFDVFSVLLDIDPSPNKIHIKGIVRWFLSGCINPDSLEETRALVERHHRLRKRLPQGLRDIVSYGTPAELSAALDDCG